MYKKECRWDPLFILARECDFSCVRDSHNWWCAVMSFLLFSGVNETSVFPPSIHCKRAAFSWMNGRDYILNHARARAHLCIIIIILYTRALLWWRDQCQKREYVKRAERWIGFDLSLAGPVFDARQKEIVSHLKAQGPRVNIYTYNNPVSIFPSAPLWRRCLFQCTPAVENDFDFCLM